MGLAKARMRSGRRGETEAVIREMAELVAGVQAVNRQAGLLMEKLVRATRSGKLTAELLDRLSDEMDAAALCRGSTLFSG
jgi:hypothetical protein